MEVLRPHDCLGDRFRAHPSDAFPRRRNSYGGGMRNSRSARKQVKLERKRNGPTEQRRSKSEENLRTSRSGGGGLVSGRVTILKRGESLDSRSRSLEMKNKNEVAMMMLCGAGRLGPEPEAVLKEEMKAFLTGRRGRDVYAGSAFVASPSPRDLPLPSFPKKKLQLSPVVVADDSATRNLRRLLGLE